MSENVLFYLDTFFDAMECFQLVHLRVPSGKGMPVSYRGSTTVESRLWMASPNWYTE